MKRQKKFTNPHREAEGHNHLNHFRVTTNENIPLQKVSQQRKFENTIEAQVQQGDSLQAIALRFHCSVAELKRLNKIDKDNEIHARKTLKIPFTAHSVLLETLPIVHKSGNNSPKNTSHENDVAKDTRRDLQTDALSEKLLVASVNSANLSNIESINNIILNSKINNNLGNYCDKVEDIPHTNVDSFTTPLLGIYEKSILQPIPIPRTTVGDLNCSGSDCDMSWVCLFIIILALCFAIPLIYVLYIAEHPERFHHNGML